MWLTIEWGKIMSEKYFNDASAKLIKEGERKYQGCIYPVSLKTFIRDVNNSCFTEFLDCVVDQQGRIYEVKISVSNTLSHLAAQTLEISYQKYLDTMPIFYYGQTDIYAMRITKAISVRKEIQIGAKFPNRAQLRVLQNLVDQEFIHENFSIVRNEQSIFYQKI